MCSRSSSGSSGASSFASFSGISGAATKPRVRERRLFSAELSRVWLPVSTTGTSSTPSGEVSGFEQDLYRAVLFLLEDLVPARPLF